MSPGPDPIQIYHLMHGSNLQGVLNAGGLLCKSELSRTGLQVRNIAYPGIQERRAVRTIPIQPGGSVHDFVPFYFCPRAPMLLAVHRGRVEGVEGGQRAIVHVVSTVEKVLQSRLAYVFCSGHAAMRFSEFFADLRDLEKLDWEVIQSNDWRDTPEDGDRKRRKQAEFLVHRFFPWHLITEIGVYDSRVAVRVSQLLVRAPHKPPVIVRKPWYY